MPSSSHFFDFSYCLSKDLNRNVALRILDIEGYLGQKRDRDRRLDLFELYSDFTAHSDELEAETEESNLYDIEQHTTLQVSVQVTADQLPLCIPAFTGYRSASGDTGWNQLIELPVKYRDLPPTAQLTITVYELKVDQENVVVASCAKAFSGLNFGKDRIQIQSTSQRLQENHPTPLTKKYKRGDISKLSWLDKLAFDKVRSVEEEYSKSNQEIHISIELPTFDFPLAFSEKENEDKSIILSVHPRFCRIYDPEMYRENLVDAKHRRLMRGHNSGPLARELKPDAYTRDKLEAIIRRSHLYKLKDEQKDLVWKFRHYLSTKPKALTKFLACVDWSDPWESKQALALLDSWAKISIEDALALLGPAFAHPAIRSFAVQQLERASDQDLGLYLLQLVQALRFDALKSDRGGQHGRHAQLSQVDSAAGSAISGTLDSEEVAGPGSSRERRSRPQPIDRGSTDGRGVGDTHRDTGPSKLAQFLIDRSLKNECLGNYFHWYLMIECEDRVMGKMYGKVAFQYMQSMMEIPGGEERREMLRRQGELVALLSKISHKVKQSKDPRQMKIEKLRALLADPKNNLASFPPLRLPLDPEVRVVGIKAEKASIFKSKMQPLFIHFVQENGQEYPIIFKTGDDMRQDQLVVQIITLMDKLLRNDNLDLRLTPFRVLATGTDQGMSQFIPSHPLASILAENNSSIINYFRKISPSLESPFGVTPAVMDTYVRSCAGYCVITYLLGVGDRHLDNLLLSPQGCLFHVDFGFILGRDPKPFPPPMKLCKEMVEAMGGMDAPFYQRFKSHCFVAFDILRRHANLILNLFQLMIESNIPDIAIEPDGAIQFVEERFRLGLSDEEAMQYFQGLILESAQALFPQRFQPSNNAGPRLVKAMKHAGGLGLVAGFMFAYAQTSMRFWGWKENTREIKKYRVEYQQALSSGNSMEGDSSLPEHIQIVSAQYSTHAAINNSFIPWFNFANHPFHSQSTSVTADVENKQ
ncbi:Phosphatidylinositol (PI) 3-kinase [Mycoemilia scoparia]|uniref:Phosphatidylinositol 3-kinase VPS34 n=1 Tax=Mycoemilia scoparia TaxID=417184 RepID=A0A9W8A3Q1_9FUNG|nr:Phosphatidylinositol (PI) 3-kinase [Mycoemilia scoparia]